MREFRFRAWDNTAKKMYYQDENWNGSNGFINLVTIYTGYEDPSEWKNYFITQYTGLKDINGAEIYEGDIVELVWDGEETILEVIFDLEELAYLGRDVRYTAPQYKYLSVNDEIEIIGNIYENPELLQEVEK